MRQLMYVAGLAMVLGSLVTPVMASIPTVPEIDASSLSLGLGLLAGAVLILRSRKHRK